MLQILDKLIKKIRQINRGIFRFGETIIWRILDKMLFGRVIFQPFFERLHKISMAGMNIGGVDIKRGGEREVLKRLSQGINNNQTPIIFDVGANVGKYSLEVISIFGKNVRLYSFEPSKKPFHLLAKSLRDREGVKTYNFGFGDKNETTILYSCREDSDLASNEESSELSSIFARQMEHFGTEMKYKEEIKLRRLDDFCRDNSINHIYLLKLDVEGNELNILNEAKELIDSNSIDFIQFEFGGCNIDSKTFFQNFFYLLNPNYRIYRILKNGLRPIDKYKEKYEMFIATNFLAVSRKL